MDVIINDASKVLDPKQLNAIVRIYDNYYSKSATKDAFPIHKWAVLPFMKDVLRGSQWHGTIDLTNSEQFSNFIKYVLG